MIERIPLASANAYLVGPEATVADAMGAIDSNGLGAVVCVDSYRHAVGTVTDGDIRRAILGGKSLNSKVESIIRQDFLFVMEGDPPAKAMSIAKAHDISIVPIVSQTSMLAGVFRASQLASPGDRGCPVLVMAGGRGARMGDLTLSKPKPMLEVNGLPLIDAVLGTAISNGFRNFFVSLNYMGHQIERHLRDSLPANVNVEFIWEDEPMGTAGALGELKEKFEKTLLVMNADIVHSVDLADLVELHEKRQSDLSIVSMEYTHQVPFGVLEINNDKIFRISEKPTMSRWVSAGIYAISHSVFKTFQFGEPCDMTDIADHLIENSGTVTPYFFEGYWRDLGNKAALEEVSKSFQEKRTAPHLESATLGTDEQ